MKMVFKIMVNQDLSNQVTLSFPMMNTNRQKISDKIIVKFGTRKKEVLFSVDENMEDNIIHMSKDVAQFFLLPVDLSYDMIISEGELHIGPVIGLLLGGKAEIFPQWRLRRFSSYALNYNDIHGLVYVFSPKGIDMTHKTIKGYYFQPHGTQSDGCWREGVFPYPDVIFRRADIPRQLYTDLTAEMGDRIINYPWANKRKVAHWLEKDVFLSDYVPATQFLGSVQELDEMLNQYSRVFLKPLSASFGQGIVIVTRKEDGDYFQFRHEPEERIIENKEELAEQVKGIIGKHKYIVQQGIEDITYEGRKLDFRLIMQKDQSRQWQCTGIVVLPGIVGGIDSHMKIYGQHSEGMTFAEAMQKMDDLNFEEIENLKKEMIEVSRKSCEVMDQHGHYGDLGVDMILDTTYHPWLIEINKRPDHSVPLLIPDRKMYETMRTRILEYARSLAGF